MSNLTRIVNAVRSRRQTRYPLNTRFSDLKAVLSEAGFSLKGHPYHEGENISLIVMQASYLSEAAGVDAVVFTKALTADDPFDEQGGVTPDQLVDVLTE